MRARRWRGERLAPDLQARIERARAALNEMRHERRGERLPPVARARRRAGRVEVVERERRLRRHDRAGRAPLGNGADVHERTPAREVAGGGIRIDVLVVAGEDVVEEEVVREIAGGERRGRVAIRDDVDRRVADGVRVTAAGGRGRAAGRRELPRREHRLQVGQERGLDRARATAARRNGVGEEVRVLVIAEGERSRRGHARRARDRAAREEVVQVDPLHVVAGQEEIERQHRIRPVRPERDARDLRHRRGVLDREERRPRRPRRRLEVDFEVGEEERRRGQDGDVAGVVVVGRAGVGGDREEKQKTGERFFHGFGFGAGPIGAFVDSGAAGEQPLPTASASISTAYRPSAYIDVTIHAWLGRNWFRTGL